MKYQGETAFLRKQLEKKEKEVEAERLSKRNLESDYKEKIQQEQKSKESVISAANSEKMFMVQEMSLLREKVKKAEIEAKIAKNGSTIKSRQVLGPVKQEKIEYFSQAEKEFSETKPKVKSTKSSETQTLTGGRGRVGRVSRGGDTVLAKGARAFCSIAPIQEQDKVRLLLGLGQVQTQAEVTRILNMNISALKDKTLNDDSAWIHLDIIENILKSFPELVALKERTIVTELCSDKISDIVKAKKSKLTVEVSGLLVAAWRPGLQEQDITSYVLSLLDKLVGVAEELESPLFISHFFKILECVTTHSDGAQIRLLCKGSPEDCFLSCVMKFVSRVSGIPEAMLALARGLTDWLEVSCSLSPPPPYLSTGCRWCCEGLLGATTHLSKLTLKRVLVLPPSDPQRTLVLNLLSSCLMALSRVQEVLREQERGEDTAWLGIINAGASLQRSYMWTMEQAQVLASDLGEGVSARLQLLVLEQQTDSDAGMET